MNNYYKLLSRKRIIITICLSLFLVSCSEDSSPTSSNGSSNRDPFGHIRVRNSTSQDIMIVNISPRQSDSWGSDWLGTNVISAGASRTFDVEPGNWDLRVIFGDGSTAEKRNITVAAGQTRSLSVSPSSSALMSESSGVFSKRDMRKLLEQIGLRKNKYTFNYKEVIQ